MIKIKESGEPLVNLKKACPDFVIDLKPKRKAFLRKTIAKKLAKAQKYLPSGTTFIIGDAFRSQEIQNEIFKSFIKSFSKKHPKWSKQKIIKEVEKYVAPSEGKLASGHLTGGAVDLRLWKNGRKISMKSSKLSYQENAKPLQPKLPKYIQKNRQIMFGALEKAGLSQNKREYWHWSYGDYWWAKRNHQKTAIYGVIKNV